MSMTSSAASALNEQKGTVMMLPGILPGTLASLGFIDLDFCETNSKPTKPRREPKKKRRPTATVKPMPKVSSPFSIDSLLDNNGPSPSKRPREAKELLLDCLIPSRPSTAVDNRRFSHSEDEGSVHGFPVGTISSLLPPPNMFNKESPIGERTGSVSPCVVHCRVPTPRLVEANKPAQTTVVPGNTVCPESTPTTSTITTTVPVIVVKPPVSPGNRFLESTNRKIHNTNPANRGQSTSTTGITTGYTVAPPVAQVEERLLGRSVEGSSPFAGSSEAGTSSAYPLSEVYNVPSAPSSPERDCDTPMSDATVAAYDFSNIGDEIDDDDYDKQIRKPINVDTSSLAPVTIVEAQNKTPEATVPAISPHKPIASGEMAVDSERFNDHQTDLGTDNVRKESPSLPPLIIRIPIIKTNNNKAKAKAKTTPKKQMKSPKRRQSMDKDKENQKPPAASKKIRSSKAKEAELKKEKENAKKTQKLKLATQKQKLVKSPPTIKKGVWKVVSEPVKRRVYLGNDQYPVHRDTYSKVQHRCGLLLHERDMVTVNVGGEAGINVAKISHIFLDPATRTLMASVVWYYGHAQIKVDPQFAIENPGFRLHDRELCASRHIDVVPLDTVSEQVYVITYNEYCRYVAENKEDELATIFRNEKRLWQRGEDVYKRRYRIPADDVEPETVFFCRHQYDFKGRRIVGYNTSTRRI